MARYPTRSEYQHGSPTRLGILITNLGTPDAPEAGALRRYLAEFLSDPRVVELPRFIWLPILHGIILNTRPRRSAAAYARVWTPDGSPLLSISRRQENALRTELQARIPGPVAVALGMRYGQPSLRSALETLQGQGLRRLLVLPLYPQYSAATTASTFDAIAKVLSGWRFLPELRLVTSYHAEPGYIAALAASIREHWAAHGRGEKLMFSFHGIPQSYFEGGDPYHCQCQMTARLTAKALQLEPGDWQVCFQSRFGPRAWLKPYTDVTVKALAKSGVRRLDIVSPGFAADCLETLEEIAMQNHEFFVEAGGEHLSYIPALNDRPDHIHMLADLLLRQAAGWPELDSGFDPATEAARRAAEAERARAMGALQ
jgi:protoporphyrin/coproporphyrin ferrochelatase